MRKPAEWQHPLVSQFKGDLAYQNRGEKDQLVAKRDRPRRVFIQTKPTELAKQREDHRFEVAEGERDANDKFVRDCGQTKVKDAPERKSTFQSKLRADHQRHHEQQNP